MAQVEPIDLSQPKNTLSDIADIERKKLFAKDDYKRTLNEYTATNPDALATGDSFGKGTGGDLDVYNQNAGAIQDILERKTEIVFNKYLPNKPYTKPSN